MTTEVVDSKGSKNAVTLYSYRSATDRQQSVPTSVSQNAVEVRRVKLTYGRGKSAKTILSEIDLTVPEGAM